MSYMVRTVAGAILAGAGLIGVLLPVVPGWPLLLAAAAVLGPDHPWTKRWRQWFEKRNG
jgi:uncharacterized membrane protein YbaN (DUF454 family)